MVTNHWSIAMQTTISLAVKQNNDTLLCIIALFPGPINSQLLLYSGKFLWGPIFAAFADKLLSAKIRSTQNKHDCIDGFHKSIIPRC